MGRFDCEMKRNMSAGGAMSSGEVGERAVVIGGYRMGGLVPCDTSSNEFSMAPLRLALSYCPQSIYSGGYDQFTGMLSNGEIWSGARRQWSAMFAIHSLGDFCTVG